MLDPYSSELRNPNRFVIQTLPKDPSVCACVGPLVMGKGAWAKQSLEATASQQEAYWERVRKLRDSVRDNKYGAKNGTGQRHDGNGQCSF